MKQTVQRETHFLTTDHWEGLLHQMFSLPRRSSLDDEMDYVSESFLYVNS